MHPLHVLLAALSVTTSLAAPSLKSYDEVFPQPKESISEPYGKEGQGVQFLDLPSLQASNDSNYRLAPQTPGTCVVICVMAPPPDWKLRLGNSMYDNYLQYACAPSCHEDIGNPSQPIKGDLRYPPPGEESKLKPEDFPVNSVVVTFDGIARPGEEGNKDGFSRAERFLISCDADQRGLDDNRRKEDRAPLENFACLGKTGLKRVWYAQVIDPYTVGRYNPIWWRTGGTAESSGVCPWAV